MGQSPSCKTSQEIPPFLWNSKMHVFTTARHLPSYWTTSIQFTSSQLTSRSILILSSHLRPTVHTRINKDVKKCFIPCWRCYAGENGHCRSPLYKFRQHTVWLMCDSKRYRPTVHESLQRKFAHKVIAYIELLQPMSYLERQLQIPCSKPCWAFCLFSLTLNYRWVLPSVSSSTHYSSRPNHWQLYRPIHWQRHVYYKNTSTNLVMHLK